MELKRSRIRKKYEIYRNIGMNIIYSEESRIKDKIRIDKMNKIFKYLLD